MIGRITAVQPHPGGRAVHVQFPTAGPLRCAAGVYTYAALSLRVGDEVRLSLRRKALMVIGDA